MIPSGATGKWMTLISEIYANPGRVNCLAVPETAERFDYKEGIEQRGENYVLSQ